MELKNSDDRKTFQRYARFEAKCKRSCDYPNSPNPHVDSEGTHKGVNIIQIRIDEMRVYGTLCHVGNKAALLFTAFDPAKKQKKANQKRLRQAAEIVNNLKIGNR